MSSNQPGVLETPNLVFEPCSKHPTWCCLYLTQPETASFTASHFAKLASSSFSCFQPGGSFSLFLQTCTTRRTYDTMLPIGAPVSLLPNLARVVPVQPCHRKAPNLAQQVPVPTQPYRYAPPNLMQLAPPLAQTRRLLLHVLPNLAQLVMSLLQTSLRLLHYSPNLAIKAPLRNKDLHSPSCCPAP